MTALRSGRVAELAGVNLQTLRYYERRGLLPVPGRTHGGHRLYPAAAVDRIRMIKAAQRLGFRLDDALAAAVAAGCDDRADCAAEPDCPLPFAGQAL